MRLMGIVALVPKPCTSKPAPWLKAFRIFCAVSGSYGEPGLVRRHHDISIGRGSGPLHSAEHTWRAARSPQANTS